jgi:hypothetical protein
MVGEGVRPLHHAKNLLIAQQVFLLPFILFFRMF